MKYAGSDVSHVTVSDISHVTGSDVSHVTGNNVTGSMFCACKAFPALFSYYSSSTKCSTVVQVPWLPKVTESA